MHRTQTARRRPRTRLVLGAALPLAVAVALYVFGRTHSPAYTTGLFGLLRLVENADRRSRRWHRSDQRADHTCTTTRRRSPIGAGTSSPGWRVKARRSRPEGLGLDASARAADWPIGERRNLPSTRAPTYKIGKP